MRCFACELAGWLDNEINNGRFDSDDGGEMFMAVWADCGFVEIYSRDTGEMLATVTVAAAKEGSGLK